MIQLSVMTAVLCGAVLALLVGGAGYALFVGWRMAGEARDAAARIAEAEALRSVSPALPLLVRADGRVEMPPRLVDWLGLPAAPRFLQDLAVEGAGLPRTEAQALEQDVKAAQRAGRGFVRALHPLGSGRAITVRGSRAPGELGATGAVVLWTLDATDSESEIGRLQAEVTDLSTAFDALSGLIEAAPLPMWYRGADLRLAMVNTAYVRAVEGVDAADVIARELELVEGSGRGGPRAGAQAARVTGKPQREILPATINGERRSLEVHDVPLPTGGVASFAVDMEDLEQSRAGDKS